MFRAIFEFIILILVSLVARSLLSSVMKGFGAAASNAFQQQQQQPPAPPKDIPQAGELHKDPVCGTYVSESTSFRRQISGKTIYYCSDVCRQKHAA
jgi:YHS domain-containing protein